MTFGTSREQVLPISTSSVFAFSTFPASNIGSLFEFSSSFTSGAVPPQCLTAMAPAPWDNVLCAVLVEPRIGLVSHYHVLMMAQL